MKLPSLETLITELIACPSVSCVNPEWDMSNHMIVEFLELQLQSLGFKTRIQEVANTHEHSTQKKYNLIATLGRGDGGMIFAGHTDTVPFNQSRWESDPFLVRIEQERLYGLGTSDMKSFFAILLDALRDIDLKQIDKPVIVIATADEETSMAGARQLTQSEIQNASYALIGEPSGLEAIHMHKGMSMYSLRLTGVAGHSSDPANGQSALDAMHHVMGDLIQWRKQWQQQYQQEVFKVPYPTMNLGHIHGGDNPNRICSQCELQFDLRPLPGMDFKTLQTEIQQVIASSLQQQDQQVQFELVPLSRGIPAFAEDLDSDFVQTVLQLTGAEAQTAGFGTEAPFYQNHGCQTVVLGPGHIEQAHQANEYIDVSQFTPMKQLIQTLIRRYCLP
jgi:acetylornithine deacetylase